MKEPTKGHEDNVLPQDDSTSAAPSLPKGYQKITKFVEEFAIDSVVERPMPSLLSFSLLSHEESSAVFERMIEEWSLATSEQDTFLFFMTEAIVLSYSNPMDMCGMFGNDFVKSQGFYKFRRIAEKLEIQWKMTFRAHLNGCFAEKDWRKANNHYLSMRSLCKLLKDLDERMAHNVRAIDINALWNTAKKYAIDMRGEIKEMKEILERQKLLASMPPKKVSSPRKKITSPLQRKTPSPNKKISAAIAYQRSIAENTEKDKILAKMKLNLAGASSSKPLTPANRNFMAAVETTPKVFAQQGKAVAAATTDPMLAPVKNKAPLGQMPTPTPQITAKEKTSNTILNYFATTKSQQTSQDGTRAKMTPAKAPFSKYQKMLLEPRAQNIKDQVQQKVPVLNPPNKPQKRPLESTAGKRETCKCGNCYAKTTTLKNQQSTSKREIPGKMMKRTTADVFNSGTTGRYASSSSDEPDSPLASASTSRSTTFDSSDESDSAKASDNTARSSSSYNFDSSDDSDSPSAITTRPASYMDSSSEYPSSDSDLEIVNLK